jgi:hypothetical protein
MKGNNNNNNQKYSKVPNPLEALKDIGSATAKQMKRESHELPKNFMEQLLNIRPVQKTYSGEIVPGEAVEMTEVFSGKYEANQKIRRQVAFEKRLVREEEARIEKRSNELRLQLNAVREEILVLAQKTENLAEETEVAAMQAPVEPGVYHVIFFEKLLEFIRSFRKKIEESAVWLQSVNKRASKKNMWGRNYKKYGAKYLLSSEHYLQRSAG